MEAAASQGADAVYFGLEGFNARYRATNFSSDELPELMGWLHQRRMSGYVALNTLVFSDELKDLERLLLKIGRAKVDAIIVQDWGLARLAREVCPDVEIHASTQMTLTEPRGLELARELGVTRAVLPREFSVEDIAKVAAQTDLPLEIFVHGAICVSYSGQCLTSEAIGGRSANRGQCAQACRQPYTLAIDGKIRDRPEGPYVLSPLDMANPDQIRRLAELGIASLKIEGRLKGPEYVATTVRTYRKAVDLAREGKTHQPDPAEWQNLHLAYSRGFSNGFLSGINHQRLVPGRHPKSRGQFLGEVIARDKRSILVRFEESELEFKDLLQPGDGVVIDEGKPEENEPGGRVWAIRDGEKKIAPGNRLFWIDLGPDDLPPRNLAPGARLHKTDSPAFRQRVREWIHAGQKLPPKSWPIEWTVSGSPGTPLYVTGTVEGLGQAEARWAGPLEEARTAPVQNFLEKGLGSLGGTPFSLGCITNGLTGSPMVPASVLKQLRREVVEKLEGTRVDQEKKPGRGIPGGLEKLRAQDRSKRKPTTEMDSPPSLVVLARTLSQVLAISALKRDQKSGTPGLVWLDFEDPRNWEEGIKICRDNSIPVGIAPLRIVKPGEEPLVARALRARPDAVLARNLATLDLVRREAGDIELVCDLTLNIVNDLSANWFLEKGITRWSPGQDLNWAQFQAMLPFVAPNQIEFVAHICMPMFHTEHCVYAANLSSGTSHLDCGRPCEKHRITLQDPAGMRFPVLVDAGCRNTVYNSRAQSASEQIGRLMGLGVRWFRVELLDQGPEETTSLVEGYISVLRGAESGTSLWQRLRLDHKIGLTRGTLNLA